MNILTGRFLVHIIYSHVPSSKLIQHFIFYFIIKRYERYMLIFTFQIFILIITLTVKSSFSRRNFDLEPKIYGKKLISLSLSRLRSRPRSRPIHLGFSPTLSSITVFHPFTSLLLLPCSFLRSRESVPVWTLLKSLTINYLLPSLPNKG